MAKKAPKASPSLLDFSEENMLDLTSEQEEIENPVEEEDEELEPEEPKKVVSKKKPVLPPAKVEEEEEEEEEEEIEEPKPKNKTGNPNLPAQEEEEEDEPAAGQQFWEEVGRITGNEVEVDYGDVDPISPQGAALREQAVAEKAIETFLNRLEEEYPAAYQALSYAHAGGDVRELYQAEKDYTKVQIADDDEEHARALLTEYYQKKGFNEVRAKRMVAADVESDEGLVGTAKAALAELQQEQQEAQQAKILEQQQAAKAQRDQDTKFLNSITGLLNRQEIGNFKIPSRQEAQEFMQFVKGSLQRDGNGGYLLVQQVDPAQLEQQLQTEYFRFKKGNLDQLIQTKAKTQATQGLKLRLESEKKKLKTSASSAPSTGSLRELDVD